MTGSHEVRGSNPLRSISLQNPNRFGVPKGYQAALVLPVSFFSFLFVIPPRGLLSPLCEKMRLARIHLFAKGSPEKMKIDSQTNPG